MEHAVFYPGPDGAPAFRRFASLEEAVGLVEHLRNVEGVEDVSVQMLTPVPLAFRAYYRVEMPAAEVPVVPEQAVVPEHAVVAEPVEAAAEMVGEMVGEMAEMAEIAPVEPVAVEASANGKHSLGFFSH